MPAALLCWTLTEKRAVSALLRRGFDMGYVRNCPARLRSSLEGILTALRGRKQPTWTCRRGDGYASQEVVLEAMQPRIGGVRRRVWALTQPPVQATPASRGG